MSCGYSGLYIGLFCVSVCYAGVRSMRVSSVRVGGVR